MADDLAAVIDATGAKEATIVGFSMGGEVARYMSRHGGRNVAQAALIASIVPIMSQTDDHPADVDPSVFKQMVDGLRRDRAHFFANFLPSFYGVGLLSHSLSGAIHHPQHIALGTPHAQAWMRWESGLFFTAPQP